MAESEQGPFEYLLMPGERVLANATPVQRCEDLTRICEATAWSADISSLFDGVVKVVADVLKSDNVHVHMFATEINAFVRCASTLDIADRYSKERTAHIGRMQWMIRTRQPIVMDYEHPHCCDVIPPDALEHGIKSAVTIPLIAGDTIMGILSVCYRTSTVWNTEDLAYLMNIGRVLGVIFHRISVAKRDKEMCLFDERKRLGAEIHDGISNLVCALSVSASSVAESYAMGDDEAVKADIERLESVARKTTRTLRDEMLSLRVPLETTDGLLSGIENCLANFEENWGIRVSFETDAVEPLVVPVTVSLQLTRILNESLSNTIKHANASKVSVSLTKDDRMLSMVISDNGSGFDVDAVPVERLGLRIMKERAAAAGGTLTLLTGDEGTTVCVDIPNWV